MKQPMDKDQFLELKLELKEHVAETIRVTVNGKIDSLKADFSKYQKEDLKWKERAEPSVVFFENITVIKRFAIWSFGILSATGGLLLVVKEIFKK